MNDLDRHPGISMATHMPDSLEPTVSNWRDVGATVAVTFILAKSVSHSWHAYHLFDKFFSVVILLSILTLPWEGFRMKKRTHSVEVWRVCILLMMVYLLSRFPL